MGTAVSVVARRGDRVVGTLGAALRDLVLPDGSRRPAAYLGDLKIDLGARGGRVLPALATAALQWVGGRATAAFAVVMGGTPVGPERYTGRLGIPGFRAAGDVAVLRLGTTPDEPPPPEWVVPLGVVRRVLSSYARGRYHTDGGDPTVRSETQPVGLVAPDGSACGWVEDTARAKRLVADDGAEMRSAHLSGFGYGTPAAAAALLRVALAVAGRSFPALFVAVPATDADAVLQSLPGVPVTVAPATVYAAGVEPGLWNVNTAEI